MSALERYYRARYNRFKTVLKWRDHLTRLHKAVEDVLPGAEVYVFGSALRDELTADSDIDILVVSKEVGGKRRERLAEAIAKQLEDPSIFEIHLVTEEKLAWYHTHAKNLVPVERIIRGAPAVG